MLATFEAKCSCVFIQYNTSLLNKYLCIPRSFVVMLGSSGPLERWQLWAASRILRSVHLFRHMQVMINKVRLLILFICFTSYASDDQQD